METRVLIKLSAAVDAMDIDLQQIESKTQREMGLKLISLLVRRLHKAETQVLELIAEYKGCTAEEASRMDVIEVIKELLSDGGVNDFFGSASQ
jgi:hypothetical protein